MTTHYYRITATPVIEAWDAYRARIASLSAAGEQFAARFSGAQALYSHGLHGRRFSGLVFNPRMPRDVWTAPDKSRGGEQRPRRALGKVSGDRAAVKAEMARVAAIYAEHEPKIEAKSDDLYKSLGTDWGQLLFVGITIQKSGDALYIATGAQLDFEEITGGAYEAALKEATT